PVEFTLLRYRPEPWTPADSLSWAKMLAWGLSINWETELLRAALIERLGPALAAELEPPPPTSWPTVMDATESKALVGLFDQRTQPAEASMPNDDLNSEGTNGANLPPSVSAPGSNNWAVAGWRSATGRPLLANDMHLLLSAPAIWYENHLVITSSAEAEHGERSRRAVPPTQSNHAQQFVEEADPSTALRSAQDDPAVSFNVIGVTFPGIPGVVAGHNGRVAWGFTNGYPDTQDLYMERLRRTDDGRVQYEYCGKWLDAEVRREIIVVRGKEPISEEVIVTHHGPIINALAPDLIAAVAGTIPAADTTTAEKDAESAQARHLALRWTALEPTAMFSALRAMNRARTCAEFREALRSWSTPPQNVVYADTQGNIAYTYAGRIPVRSRGDGRVPVPGWTGEYEWQGYIPFDELPQQLNPPCGYIATANNRVADESYPYFLSREFAMGDRAERIVALLQTQARLDPAFFRQMQQDQVSPTMQAIAGYLGSLTVADPELAAVVALVRRWDGRLTADSPAATICEVCARLMMQVILERRLGDLAERVLGKGPTPILQEASFFSHRAWEWLLHILTQPNSHWFDLGHGETRDEVMQIALGRTLAYLWDRLGEPGPDFCHWAWGRMHTLTFGHLAGSVPALARHLNRGPFPVGGDGNTLWATGNGLTPEASTTVIGPPFRFVADLGDLDHCWGCLVPGNSGRPTSPHYDDQIEAWFQGEYHPMLYAREDVERGAVAKLRLNPSRVGPLDAKL
ncbi:MAG: penicillin acylase family protein, partial [Anaerolineae bacterium]